jgi:hypothetical protein
MNVVAFSGAEITWNVQPLTHEKLREYLSVVTTMNPIPYTMLDATRAPDCRTATKLRDELLIVSGEGLCVQGSLADWKTAPGLSGPGWIE